MTDDFVARLRIRWESMGEMANVERAAAAAEIDALRQSQRSLMAQVAALGHERDAARREVCAHLSSESALLAIRRTPEEIAASRGWLCFPPEPKETP